ncbi:MAG TPA: protein-L-isoaspartate(D-aspartate) O-methyltransferase [Sulfuricaulis sp.]|nr:protein-L-isoaspartate(D-aspartate) O-methyltransferase [Sulfuricaulis sp.]
MTSRRTRDRLLQRLREEGIRDERVLEAIRNVPRHVFVDEALATRAYEDTALPIGHGQTISQPYIVALLTQALIAGDRLKKVLEVGTGSGYQTAVLAGLVDEIYSVERLEPLMKLARKRLSEIGCRNVHVKLSDGSWGWKEHAPYDGIIVTAAPAEVPQALLEQLAPDGRLVIPVGGPAMQELLLVQKTDKGLNQERLELVNFVPLVRNSF